MRAASCGALLALVLGAAVLQAAAQDLPDPDLGPAGEIVDDVGGTVVPPALNLTYGALGQNLTREDVRIFADLNITKGDFSVLGLLVGSGKAEVQAALDARLEMRVISSDRIRAMAEGENAYNVSAENATFLSQVFLPAEAFRASLSAEALAAFQASEEDALRETVSNMLPELDILAIDFAWDNTLPQQGLTDLNLTEPPIVLEVAIVAQWIRVETIPSLVSAYLRDKADTSDEGRDAYVKRLKQDNGDALHARDFFAAAAYTQLLNLSLQPGWSLDMTLSVPKGYDITYTNQEVESLGPRRIAFGVDARESDEDVKSVFLASVTNKQAVALALFVTLWVVGLVVAAPLRLLHGATRRKRLGEPRVPLDPQG